MRRTIRQPGRSRSNRKAVRCRRVSAGFGSVRAITMKCCAIAAPEMNHLRPVMVQAPPRRSARVRIIPGSEPPPGAGSVIAKDELTAAGNDRQEPARLLVLARDRGEKAHVAVVRRRAVEDGGPEDRAVRRLVEGRLGNHRKAESAKTDRHLRRPQAGAPSPSRAAGRAAQAGCSRAHHSFRRRPRAAESPSATKAATLAANASCSGASVKSIRSSPRKHRCARGWRQVVLPSRDSACTTAAEKAAVRAAARLRFGTIR